jgi:hypothetical protein
LHVLIENKAKVKFFAHIWNLNLSLSDFTYAFENLWLLFQVTWLHIESVLYLNQLSKDASWENFGIFAHVVGRYS